MRSADQRQLLSKGLLPDPHRSQYYDTVFAKEKKKELYFKGPLVRMSGAGIKNSNLPSWWGLIGKERGGAVY